jgi:phage gpG-like protein
MLLAGGGRAILNSRVMKADFSKFNKFIKGLETKARVRIGLFGDKSAREAGAATNPEIGAVHELGSVTRNIPPRSFLRVPILLNASRIIAKVKASSAVLLIQGNIKMLMARLGIACENEVQEAFDTSGHGTWPPLKDPTRRGKNPAGDARPLIDTRQLRAAVASKVV